MGSSAAQLRDFFRAQGDTERHTITWSSGSGLPDSGLHGRPKNKRSATARKSARSQRQLLRDPGYGFNGMGAVNRNAEISGPGFRYRPAIWSKSLIANAAIIELSAGAPPPGSPIGRTGAPAVTDGMLSRFHPVDRPGALAPLFMS